MSNWHDFFTDDELEKIAGYYPNPRQAQINKRINNVVKGNKNPENARKVITNELSNKGISNRSMTKDMSIDAVGNQNQGGVNAAINRGQLPTVDNRLAVVTSENTIKNKEKQRASIDKEVRNSMNGNKSFNPLISKVIGGAGALGIGAAGLYGLHNMLSGEQGSYAEDVGYDPDGMQATLPIQAGIGTGVADLVS